MSTLVTLYSYAVQVQLVLMCMNYSKTVWLLMVSKLADLLCMKVGLEDLKQICGTLSQLKNEMQTNKKLTELPEDGIGDESLWNACLQADSQIQRAAGAESAWFVSPWLLIECYFYRRIYSAIQLRLLTVIFVCTNHAVGF